MEEKINPGLLRTFFFKVNLDCSNYFSIQQFHYPLTWIEFTGQTTKRNNKFVLFFCDLTFKLYNLFYSVSYLPRYYLEMIDWQSTLQSRQLFNWVPWGEFMHYWEMRSVKQVKKIKCNKKDSKVIRDNYKTWFYWQVILYKQKYISIFDEKKSHTY